MRSLPSIIIAGVWFYFFPILLQANMASPIAPGSFIGSPIASDSIDILREELFITPDSAFELAQIKAVYHIRTDHSGKILPLVFYASNLQNDFGVTVDGKEIEFLQFGKDCESLITQSRDAFLGVLGRMNCYRDLIELNSIDSPVNYLQFEDMVYFEVDLSEGEHAIEVNYVAGVWGNSRERVKKIFFMYLLEPAMYWKSYGGLDLVIDNSKHSKPVKINLESPQKGQLNEVGEWHFDSLPALNLVISLDPDLSAGTKFLLWISPFGLTGIFLILLFIIEIFWIRSYRRNHSEPGFSVIGIFTGLVFPFVYVLFYMAMKELEFRGLGEFKGGAGYGEAFAYIFVMGSLVLTIPINLILTAVIDKHFWKKWMEKKGAQ